MTKTKIYNLAGKETSELTLAEKIFNVKPNMDLLHQAVSVQVANSHYSNAHTKTRGEVAGSGHRPWKQKGTGRARVGDARTPLWKGGGTVFGPSNVHNHHLKISKQGRRKAINMAFSDKATNKKIIILDKIHLDGIKTSEAEKLLQKMPIKEGTILIMIAKSDPAIELSFRNLPYVKILNVKSANVYDILKYEWLITDKAALIQLEEFFLGKKEIAPEIKTSTKVTKAKVTKVAANKTKSKKISKKAVK